MGMMTSDAKISRPSLTISLPDIGDIAPGGVVAPCVADIERMLADQRLAPTALHWIAMCDHFLSGALESAERRTAFWLLRDCIRRDALSAVIVEAREPCLHLADSEEAAPDLEAEPCSKCGRYYVE